MKWYPSILQVQKADEPKTLSKAFIFCFGFRYAILQSDASLGGLRKIECSSIKIKSKETHKITSRILRYSSWTFGSRKSQCEPGVLAVENSSIWCWKFWHLRTQPSAHLRSSPIESPNGSREFWVPEVSAPVGSPSALGLSPLARLQVGSSDVSRKSRLPEVSAFHRKF